MRLFERIRKKPDGGKEGNNQEEEFDISKYVEPNTEPVYLLGIDSNTEERKGLYKSDRGHMLIIGRTQYGKTTLIETLILEHVQENEPFVYIDPSGDSVNKILALIPDEKRKNTILIDPMTIHTHGKVVKIDFLEYSNSLSRLKVAQGFIDAVKKLSGGMWGPLLERIMRNTILLLIDQEKGSTDITDCYYVINDVEYRERLMRNCSNKDVVNFFVNDFGRIRPESLEPILTRLNTILVDPLVKEMFKTKRKDHSTIKTLDLRGAIDSGKFVLVNLSKARLGETCAFIGSLLLDKIFQTAISRADERVKEKRKACYLYVDEAHTFVTDAVIDILREVAKYRLYLTLVTQYPSGFTEEIKKAVFGNCSTIITFSVGPDTAKEIAPFFAPYDTQTIMLLPRYEFMVSTKMKGMPLKPFSLSTHHVQIKDSELIKRSEECMAESLRIYGQEVSSDLEDKGDGNETIVIALKNAAFPRPPFFTTPIKWFIQTRLFFDRNGSTTKVLFEQAVSSPHHHKPYNAGFQKVKAVLHEMVREGSVQTIQVTGDNQADEKRYAFILTESGLKPFYEIPKGARAGGDIHLNWMDLFLHAFWRMGWYCIADNGLLSEGHSDIYAFPPKLTENGSKYDPDEWEIPPAWAVEFEVYPERHPDRVMENYLRNASSRIKTVFVTDSEERKKRILQALKEHNVSAYVPVLLVNRAATHAYVEKVVHALTAIREPALLEQAIAEAESSSVSKGQEKENVRDDVEVIAEKQNPAEMTSTAISRPEVEGANNMEERVPQEEDGDDASNTDVSGENEEQVIISGEDAEEGEPSSSTTVMDMLYQELADDESLASILLAVKENPGLKSSDILPKLDMSRRTFMRKSLKLKELGLISAMERVPGYTITERGMALLEEIRKGKQR
jgi:DNA-binding transcriptional ArsR family regulator